MPRTFRDAIRTAVEMKYTHIWIDAFCIIQDDEADLAKELPKMGDIYRYADLTIYPAVSESARSGIFRDRDPLSCRPCTIPIAATIDGMNTTRDVTVAVNHIGQDHLKSRGWILQEHVLSSRCLVFHERQISWSCTEGEAHESQPALQKPRGLRDRHNFSPAMMRQLLYAQLEAKPHSRNPQQIALALRTWDMMLEEYSDRHLSFVADNLSALSGLAALFHEAYGTTYAAGLWKERLPTGLAWYVRVNDTKTVAAEPLVPSWSWASVGQVRIRLYRAIGSWQPINDASAEVMEVCCTPASAENSFGSLQRGVITMKAWLRTGRLKTSQAYAEARVNMAYSGRLEPGTGVEEEVLAKTLQARFPGLLLDMENSSSVADTALDRDMTSAGSRVVSCDLLAANSHRDKCQATLLILERDPITGQYSRLGIAILGPERIGWMGLGNDRDVAAKQWGRPRREIIQIV